jgi:hypothetical protein
MFGAICAAIAGYSLYKAGHVWPWFFAGSGLFLLGGLVGRPLLRPVYVLWMKFAFILGWVNTRLILGIFFYGILTPIGLIMRLFGWDPLARKINRDAPTYWEKRPEKAYDPKSTERLF